MFKKDKFDTILSFYTYHIKYLFFPKTCKQTRNVQIYA
jgi:hypothetical protein